MTSLCQNSHITCRTAERRDDEPRCSTPSDTSSLQGNGKRERS